jgi:fructose/tagatose bisphosphate aldolase
VKKEYVTPEIKTVELHMQSSVLQECSQEEIPVIILGNDNP